jgi:acetyl esterase/lipase
LRGRRGLAALLALLAGVLVARALYEQSVQPRAEPVTTVVQRRPAVTPPAGFARIAAAVTERRVRVPAGGAPAAHLDIFAPSSSAAEPRPMILWVHGGGYVANSSATVRDYAILLAHAGYTVASLDYSLAPAARYPVPVRQGDAALRYLAANARRFGGDPARIVLGGDSAGAQIAGQLAAVQTNAALAASMGLTAAVAPRALRGVVLFCGLYDMRTVARTGFPGLRTFLWAYTGTRDWTAFARIDQLSVTRHVTSRYPPAFLTVGDADPFRFQAAELAAVLRRHGVAVTTLFWTGTGAHLRHEYQFNFELPQARTAFQRTLDFLATTTGG